MSSAVCPSLKEAHIIRIYLVDGSYNNVKYDDTTTVEKIIKVVVDRFCGTALDSRYYALRLVQSEKNSTESDYEHWLPSDYTVEKAFDEFSLSDNLRFELRIRFFCKNLEKMFREQTASFYYLFDQIKKQYLLDAKLTLKSDLAIELGSLDIRRFLKDMCVSAFEKKSNFDFLTKEVGLNRFFPANILALHKPKALRKIVQSYFKKYASFSEADCIFRFFALLSEVARYDEESFKCFLGSNWAVPVELIISAEHGISYVTDSKRSPIKLVDFDHVLKISTDLIPNDALKATVTVQVSTTSEPLVITCSSCVIADSIAHLIDGYRVLHGPNDCKSIWTRQGDKRSLDVYSKFNAALSADSTTLPRFTSDSNGTVDDIDADYASPASKDFELDRAKILVEELLGEGQFGDVYKGQYEIAHDTKISIAIKACKLEREADYGGNILEEAYVMQQFDHPHIVKLIGMCSASPIWIIMELAALGELRAYLIEHRNDLNLITLISFCCQLSSALSYLESRNFVHRDIAARNVLVFGPDEIKLSDFGLSRQVDEQSFYTASKGKLPIKWMAPESINFRRFTPASDVWMFAVAMWEILSMGVKPFQGVRNHDVIHRIEEGERLPKPPNCPKDLYDLMLNMWEYEPCSRPKMFDVKIALNEILAEVKNCQNYPFAGDVQANRNDNDDAVVALRQNNMLVSGRNCQNDKFSGRHFINGLNEWKELRKEINDCLFNSLDRNRKIINASAYARCHAGKPSAPLKERRTSVSNIDKESIEKMLIAQRMQSEEDSAWLESEETNMLLPSSEFGHCETDTNSASFAQKTNVPKKSSETLQNATIQPPSAELCRRNDRFYDAVLSVVQCINVLTKSVPRASPEEYVDLVKDIGTELKRLLILSGDLAHLLPTDARSEITMAEKLLSSSMQKLVGAMRLAIQNAQTTLSEQFRLQMLAEAHILAVECKNFLQAVDSSRIKANLADFVSNK